MLGKFSASLEDFWPKISNFFEQSSPFSVLITSITGVIFVYIIFSSVFLRRNKLPRGPRGVPLLGYFPFLTRQPYKKFNELRKDYGDIYTVQLGSVPTVILNGWETIKEAFSQDALTGRPLDVPFKLFAPLTSFGTSDGPLWKEQRRHAFNVLKILGFGQISRMQYHVADEIASLMRIIDSKLCKPLDGEVKNVVDEKRSDTEDIVSKKVSSSDSALSTEAINVRTLLSPSMSNIITSLVFGERYEHGSDTRKFLDKILDNSGANPLLFALMIVFPNKKWLFNLFSKFNLLSVNYVRGKSKQMVQFTEERITEHVQSLDQDVIRDYIDGFLIEKMRRDEAGEKSSFTLDMLSGNVRGFFSAGSDTVRTTLEWLLLLLSDPAYSHVQERMYQEISNVTKTGADTYRLPCYDDRLKVPYTMAVLHEIQRWKTIVPLNLARRCITDVKVGGVLIPEDTQVLANFWSVHFDEKIFPEPEKFNPNHFLEEEVDDTENNETKNGSCAESKIKFKKRSEFVAFSLGKRSCPGESLAMIELFLYTTSLIQKYVITAPSEAIDYTESLGITSQPKAHVHVIFAPRMIRE